MDIDYEFDYATSQAALAETEYETQNLEQQRHLSGGLPGVVEIVVASHLFTFVSANHLGWVFGADTEFIAPGFKKKIKNVSKMVELTTGRKQPDIAFISIEHLPAVPRGPVLMAPDLAVEVYSENDKTYDAEDKVDEYLAVGVKIVWLIRPVKRLIEVYHPGDKKPLLLGIDDELDGGEVLPGFKLKVAEIFRNIVEASPEEI